MESNHRNRSIRDFWSDQKMTFEPIWSDEWIQCDGYFFFDQSMTLGPIRIKWSPTSRGEGWSLRNRVSRVSKGGATITRRIAVSPNYTKIAMSIIIYHLRDLKVFCNLGILRKSIMNYHIFWESRSWIIISFKNISESVHDWPFKLLLNSFKFSIWGHL